MANKRRTAAQKQRAKARQLQHRAAANDGHTASEEQSAPPTKRPGARPAKHPAQRRPAARRRRSTGLSWSAIAAVVAVVAVMALIFVTRKSSPSGGGGGSDAAIAKATSVSAATFEKIGVPSDAQTVPALPASVPPVVSGGKQVVTYIGAEYCPYCAAERWPFVVALSRFGTFSNLGTTTSAPKPEPYPETPTFSFHGSGYTSDYLVLSAVETQTNKPDATTGGWTPLDTPTAEQQQLLTTYDTQQYTGSDGGIPFIMIGNLYAWAGATYDPTVLGGLSFDQIANQLDTPDSKVAQGVDGAANQITAMICKLTGSQPTEVCSAPSIQQAQAALPTP